MPDKSFIEVIAELGQVDMEFLSATKFQDLHELSSLLHQHKLPNVSRRDYYGGAVPASEGRIEHDIRFYLEPYGDNHELIIIPNYPESNTYATTICVALKASGFVQEIRVNEATF